MGFGKHIMGSESAILMGCKEYDRGPRKKSNHLVVLYYDE